MLKLDARQDKVVKDILYVKGTEPAKVRKIVFRGMASYFKAIKTLGLKIQLQKKL